MDYEGERKATRDNTENERLRETIKVQIVLRVKIKCMRGKCERRNEGFRGELKKGTRSEENKRCR